MAHSRKLLRQAVVALLVGASTAAGARVYMARVDPLKKGALPALAVYTLSEGVDVDTSKETAPRELTREADVEVVLYVGGPDEETLVNSIDDFAEQVEAAMDADPYFGGTASDSILASTVIEIRENNGGSDPLVGIAVLTYAVTYFTQPGAVTATDDFRTVGATQKIAGGVSDTVPASEQFTVQETPP